jgi:RNA polymerase sigma-70 factor (ECF subfamily)
MELPVASGHEHVDVSEPSDLELWRCARDGDAAAFGLLFDRHSRAIYNYCFRRTADWSAAEDLTSLAFLEAWRRRGSVEFIDGRVLPWLFGVATNLIHNHRRTARRRRRAMARLAPAREQHDFADEVVERLADEQTMRSLLDQLGALPRAMQDVVALCVWSDMSYEEAALALGVPVGTVRSRLSRARARLGEPRGRSGHERGVIDPSTATRNENPA